MSRRYGRTQKRKHREQISKLENSLKTTTLFQVGMVEKLKQAYRTIEDMVETIESVSQNSICLPPKTMNGYESRNHIIIPIRKKEDFKAIFHGNTINDNINFKTVNVFALRLFLQEQKDQFEIAVHLEYAAGENSAYMISENALQSMPENYLVERFSKDIATQLIQHIKQL
jgi:hypothetical protein